jgi:hypothetical protein
VATGVLHFQEQSKLLLLLHAQVAR